MILSSENFEEEQKERKPCYQRSTGNGQPLTQGPDIRYHKAYLAGYNYVLFLEGRTISDRFSLAKGRIARIPLISAAEACSVLS